MTTMKRYMDWLFKDLNGRKGKYVITENPNGKLITFMVAIVLAVISYPGFFQTSFALIAYIALFLWGLQEFKTGRSRFRRLLGIMSIIAVIGAVLLRLGLSRIGF